MQVLFRSSGSLCYGAHQPSQWVARPRSLVGKHSEWLSGEWFMQLLSESFGVSLGLAERYRFCPASPPFLSAVPLLVSTIPLLVSAAGKARRTFGFAVTSTLDQFGSASETEKLCVAEHV